MESATRYYRYFTGKITGIGNYQVMADAIRDWSYHRWAAEDLRSDMSERRPAMLFSLSKSKFCFPHLPSLHSPPLPNSLFSSSLVYTMLLS